MGSDARRRLFRQSKPELVEQQAVVVVRLRVARQDEFAPSDVGRWTSTIWMVANFSITVHGVRPGAWALAMFLSVLNAGGRVAGVLANGLEGAAMRRDHREALMNGRMVLTSPYDPAACFQVGQAMRREVSMSFPPGARGHGQILPRRRLSTKCLTPRKARNWALRNSGALQLLPLIYRRRRTASKRIEQ